MGLTGSPVVDRLIEATNSHNPDAMVACFHQDYRSEQPVHPEAGFSGREQVAKNWSLMFEEVPDLRFDGVRSAMAANEVWTEVRASGRKLDRTLFDYRGVVIWGVREDRIAWARLYFEPVEVGGADIDERMRHVLGESPEPQ